MDKRIDLIYAANPPYGGWVTFTVHLIYCLSRNYKVRLFKIGKKTEAKLRDFGYGVKYQNISLQDTLNLSNPLITAIDNKHYDVLKYASLFSVVIHDPTELKKEVIDALNSFKKVYTIRNTVSNLLEKKYYVENTFMLHPFFKYPVIEGTKHKAVAISRVDFDKNTDIILKANMKLKNPIDIYGAVNRLYTHFKLKELNFEKYYKGKFDKDFKSVALILKNAKYMVDMSSIKNDGAGTQYTFLEAIHAGSALVLNDKWFNTWKDVLNPGLNCFSVKDDKELVELLNNENDTTRIVKSARAILDSHDLMDLP